MTLNAPFLPVIATVLSSLCERFSVPGQSITIDEKKPRTFARPAGLERREGSGSLRQAAHFGDGGLAVDVFVQYLARIADAGAAHGADAQFLAQFGHRRDAQFGRLADFTVGDVVADTDDH